MDESFEVEKASGNIEIRLIKTVLVQDSSSNRDSNNQDKESRNRNLRAKTSFNLETKDVKVELESIPSRHKMVSYSLSFREKEIFSSARHDLFPFYKKTLSFSLTDDHLHVFYDTYLFVYKYVIHDDDSKMYEGHFEIKITLIKDHHLFEFSTLEHYRPPSYLVQLFDGGFKEESCSNFNERALIKQIAEHQQTTLENRDYKTTVKMLRVALAIEDMDCQQELMQLKLDGVYLQLTGHNDTVIPATHSYTFVMPQDKVDKLKMLRQTEISVIVAYKMKTKRDTKSTTVSGKITRIDGKNVHIMTSFDLRSDSTYTNYVKFEYNRISTRASINALDSIEKLSLLEFLSDFNDKSVLYEEAKVKEEFSNDKFEWSNPQVGDNEEQQTAIKNIVNCSAFPNPYVIFGPPGTGKTSTLVECVSQISKLKPKSRILITAQSNSACEEIGTRLMKSVPLSKILRLYSSSIEKSKLDLMNKDLIASSNMRNIRDVWPSKEEFDYFNIVIVTLMSSNRLAQSDLRKGHFDYIFLDECASATEPESLVPIVGLGTLTKVSDGYVEDKRETIITANIVILGDHKQLGAVIQSELAKAMGLGISLMERIMTKQRYMADPVFNSKCITQLLDNYRCHPAILKFSSEMFYGKMLRSKVSDELRFFAEKWKFLSNKNFPVLFHSLKSSSEVIKTGTSSFNEGEVKQVQFYVKELLENGIEGSKVFAHDIGIISPYLAQLQLLRKVLHPTIEIGSAEYYQGREKKIIIISTVKSKTGVGFLKNEKRLNVILTRAQSLMIVIGNPETLQQDPLWKAFVNYCFKHNAFTGEKFTLKP